MELAKLQQLIEQKVNSLGYDLAELVSHNEKGNIILSVVVDRINPIGMDDIVELTHSLSDYLDEIDMISVPYTLDISSLGAEKPLKIEQLDQYVGRYVSVHLINPIEGNNIYEGTLESLDEKIIKLSYRIKTRTKLVDIEKGNISKIRLAIKF